MPLMLPAEAAAGGELLSLEDVNGTRLQTAQQRSLMTRQREMNRTQDEDVGWRPTPGATSSATSRWGASGSMGSQAPHVWVGGIDKRSMTSI
eukprot:7306133-Alexandrium_andersonii.AAC.1